METPTAALPVPALPKTDIKKPETDFTPVYELAAARDRACGAANKMLAQATGALACPTPVLIARAGLKNLEAMLEFRILMDEPRTDTPFKVEIHSYILTPLAPTLYITGVKQWHGHVEKRAYHDARQAFDAFEQNAIHYCFDLRELYKNATIVCEMNSGAYVHEGAIPQVQRQSSCSMPVRQMPRTR